MIVRWRNVHKLLKTLALFRSATNSSETAPLQLTLAIVKPHAVSQPFVLQVNNGIHTLPFRNDGDISVKLKEIDESILKEGFYVVRSQEIYLSREEASKFYDEHRGRFFYQRAVELMSSGPIIVKILARINAISHWRTLMGPTKVFKTKLSHPETLRGRFGLTDTRNAVHGSDSEASTARECGFFLPDFSVTQWYEQDEPVYRAGNVQFDEAAGVHVKI